MCILEPRPAKCAHVDARKLAHLLVYPHPLHHTHVPQERAGGRDILLVDYPLREQPVVVIEQGTGLRVQHRQLGALVQGEVAVEVLLSTGQAVGEAHREALPERGEGIVPHVIVLPSLFLVVVVMI